MKKVLVGISGGVDSAVSALLLKQQGYEVVGATMILFGDIESNQSIEDAKKVCKQLNIEHHIIDLMDTFKEKVINSFIKSYKDGETPNPCIECNRFLKFGALFEKGKELGCEYIATGHYAKVNNGMLFKADDEKKDQTYFLYKIEKKVLPYIIFPLENLDKEIIRKIAKDNNLIVADKKDSQEICFIPNDDYANYLESNLSTLPDAGDFVLKDGTLLGKHKGIIYYTIGQRKGLGISYKIPLYVIEINKQNNTIVLGEEKDLYNNILIATDVNLLVDLLPKEVMAKVRYRSKISKAQIEIIDNNNVKVVFEEPQRSITKGQSVVFYDNDICLGGGIIKEIITK